MSFELRVLAVGLAAFAFAGAVAGLAVPLVVSRLNNSLPIVRARQLVLLRLIPASSRSPPACSSPWRSSPSSRAPKEKALGGWRPRSASSARSCSQTPSGGSTRIVLATRRLARTWFAGARPVALDGISIPAFATASEFPIVAVVGVRRPKLIIARVVLDACSTEELRAILAHEQGHLDRRDNLRRLLMSVAPDVLAWLPASERLLRPGARRPKKPPTIDAAQGRRRRPSASGVGTHQGGAPRAIARRPPTRCLPPRCSAARTSTPRAPPARSAIGDGARRGHHLARRGRRRRPDRRVWVRASGPPGTGRTNDPLAPVTLRPIILWCNSDPTFSSIDNCCKGARSVWSAIPSSIDGQFRHVVDRAADAGVTSAPSSVRSTASDRICRRT